MHVISSSATEADLAKIPAPLAAVSCVPSNQPLDASLEKVVEALLSKSISNGPYTQALLDVAYLPLVTPVMEIAKKQGFKTIGGRDMLVYQGVEQFQIWNGAIAPVEVAMEAVYNADN